MKKQSKLEIYFRQHLKDHNIEMEEEHKFHPVRRWRFDFADVANKIAIELEGGVWIRGRHNRGSGYIKDTYKYNEAVKLGWRVLRYCTVDDIHKNFLEDYQSMI